MPFLHLSAAAAAVLQSVQQSLDRLVRDKHLPGRRVASELEEVVAVLENLSLDLGQIASEIPIIAVLCRELAELLACREFTLTLITRKKLEYHSWSIHKILESAIIDGTLLVSSPLLSVQDFGASDVPHAHKSPYQSSRVVTSAPASPMISSYPHKCTPQLYDANVYLEEQCIIANNVTEEIIGCLPENKHKRKDETISIIKADGNVTNFDDKDVRDIVNQEVKRAIGNLYKHIIPHLVELGNGMNTIKRQLHSAGDSSHTVSLYTSTESKTTVNQETTKKETQLMEQQLLSIEQHKMNKINIIKRKQSLSRLTLDQVVILMKQVQSQAKSFLIRNKSRSMAIRAFQHLVDNVLYEAKSKLRLHIHEICTQLGFNDIKNKSENNNGIHCQNTVNMIEQQIRKTMRILNSDNDQCACDFGMLRLKPINAKHVAIESMGLDLGHVPFDVQAFVVQMYAAFVKVLLFKEEVLLVREPAMLFPTLQSEYDGSYILMPLLTILSTSQIKSPKSIGVD